MNRIHDIFTLNIGSSAVTVLIRGMLQTKGSAYIEHIRRDLRPVYTCRFIKMARFLISIVSMETAHFLQNGSQPILSVFLARHHCHNCKQKRTVLIKQAKRR